MTKTNSADPDLMPQSAVSDASLLLLIIMFVLIITGKPI